MNDTDDSGGGSNRVKWLLIAYAIIFGDIPMMIFVYHLFGKW